MKDPYQTYLDNLATVGKLMKPQINSGMDEKQVLEEIHGCADRLYRIHQENDGILNEILFSKTADTLTGEEAACLSELAGALFNYNRSPDTGIAYRIHRLLHDYAKYRQDTDLLVRELYYLGITVNYMNVRDTGRGINLFLDQVGAYFRAGAAYLDRYEELENPQTRSFILRCLGNVKYGLERFQGGNHGKKLDINDGWGEYMECFTRAMDIFHSPYYRQMNPEIPWDTFIYTMHYDRTQFLTGLRNRYDPEIAGAVLESAEYVYRRQEKIAQAGEKAIGIRTQYVYAAARYHAGLIPAEELLEVLFAICESADLHDFSSDNIWALLFTPEYLMHYLGGLPEEKQAQRKPRLQEAFAKQREYLFLLPKNEYGQQVSRSISSIASYLSGQDVQFFRQLLGYILACHPPTYVHSTMVALLTRRFCERIAGVAPQMLSGTFGFTGEREVLENLDSLLEKAYLGGLYHDLGKCMLLNYVGLYGRKLLDEEFACIRQHAAFGCGLLEDFQMEDMAGIAHYHHRTYDGRGGYPNCKGASPEHIRCIVDIVTVVDSLDAGTDNVGRSYAAAKSYEQLVEELRRGKGTRYATEIVELLDDADFYEDIRQFIAEKRNQVYLDIYLRQL